MLLSALAARAGRAPVWVAPVILVGTLLPLSSNDPMSIAGGALTCLALAALARSFTRPGARPAAAARPVTA